MSDIVTSSKSHRVRPLRWLYSQIALLFVSVVGLLPAAWAEDDSERRRAAGTAYAQAQRETLADNHVRAAELFEKAYELVPSPQALRAALQLRQTIGHHRVAIAQAEELLRRYPYDVTSRALAIEVLDTLSSRFVRAYITCEPSCTVKVDGRDRATAPAREHVLYLNAGRRRLVAVFDGGRSVSKRIRRNAGEPISLRIEAPEADSVAAPTDAESAEEKAADNAAADDDGVEGAPLDLLEAADVTGAAAGASTDDEVGNPPLLPLLVGGVVTVGFGAATIVSHRDAVSQPAGDDADSASLRTRVLLGATAAAAASTVIMSVIWARVGNDPDQADAGQRAQIGFMSAGDSHWVGLVGQF